MFSKKKNTPLYFTEHFPGATFYAVSPQLVGKVWGEYTYCQGEGKTN